MTSNLDILRAVAKEKGADAATVTTLEHIMSAESGGKTNSKNPHSSATGLFQFIDKTWAGLVAQHPGELTMNGRGDPRQQCIAAVYFARDNANKLRAATGHEPSAGELYLAHFLGSGGASNVLSHSPGESIAGIVGPSVMSSNAGVNLVVGGKKKMFANFTVADLKAWADTKMGQELNYNELSEAERLNSWMLRNPGRPASEMTLAEGDLAMAQLFVQCMIGLFKMLCPDATPSGQVPAGDTPTLPPLPQAPMPPPSGPTLAPLPPR